MKSTGIIMLVPALLALPTFRDIKQYLLGIFPNFWFTKALMNKMLPFAFNSPSDLSFYWYIAIGIVLSLVYSVLIFKFFMKRAIK